MHILPSVLSILGVAVTYPVLVQSDSVPFLYPDGSIPVVPAPRNSNGTDCYNYDRALTQTIQDGINSIESTTQNGSCANTVENGCTPLWSVGPKRVPRRVETGVKFYICGEVNRTVTGYDVAGVATSVELSCKINSGSYSFASGTKFLSNDNSTWLYIMADHGVAKGG